MAESYKEMVTIADDLASEHVQVMTVEPDYFHSCICNDGTTMTLPVMPSLRLDGRRPW